MKSLSFKIKFLKIKLLTAAVFILLLTACKDNFLDVEPQGQRRTENFFETAEDAIRSITACYGHLNTWKVNGFAHLAITSITSDDAEKGSVPGDASFLNDFDDFTFTSTQFIINDYWTGQYEGINLCNQSIENIPNIQMDPNLKTRLIAEARFIRAYYYFNLVRAFGDVPKVDHLPVTPEELNPTRSPKSEIYALIEQDLNAAAAVLPVSYSAENTGRATKGAALGMLAKVKMYQQDWAAVLNLTEQVMAMPYSLVNNYYKVFRVQNENNSESIFEVQAQVNPNDCGSMSQYSEVQAVRNQFGWGFNVPTANLANAYKAGDVRREATLLFRGETTPEGDVIIASAPNPMYNQKVYVSASVPNPCGWGYGRDKNRIVLRLGEILLIHAEAANEFGQTQKALTSLNRIRTRAGLAAVNITDKTLLRQAIWEERRVELAMEEDRFFDLVRQGRAGEVLRAQGKQFVSGKNEVFAIPQRQIDLSGGKLTQNPGY